MFINMLLSCAKRTISRRNCLVPLPQQHLLTPKNRQSLKILADLLAA